MSGNEKKLPDPTKFTQQHETTMNFNFYNLLGKQMTQCFTSIRMPNIG